MLVVMVELLSSFVLRTHEPSNDIVPDIHGVVWNDSEVENLLPLVVVGHWTCPWRWGQSSLGSVEILVSL